MDIHIYAHVQLYTPKISPVIIYTKKMIVRFIFQNMSVLIGTIGTDI